MTQEELTQKSREFAIARYGNNGGPTTTQNEMAKVQACAVGYRVGWNEALKQILVDASKELPKYEEDVWVINERGEEFFSHRCNQPEVVVDKDGWCNYSGSDIIAWIRNSTIKEILSMNKDVLKRVKKK